METLKVKGKITAKDVKQGDEWVRAAFTINEHKYSSFDQEIIDNFNIGNVVEAEFTKSKDGKYNNIQAMKISDDAGLVTAEKVVDWDAKDLRQAKMAGLKAATALIDILARCDPEGTKAKLAEVNPVDLTKDIATQLVSYIYGS